MRERQRNLPTAGLLFKWPQHSKLDQAEVKSQDFIWVLHESTGAQGLGSSSASFPDTLSESLTGTGAAGTLTGTFMGFRCCKLSLTFCAKAAIPTD